MVLTRNYRTVDSVYANVTQPQTAIGGVLRLTLPEPRAVRSCPEASAFGVARFEQRHDRRAGEPCGVFPGMLSRTR